MARINKRELTRLEIVKVASECFLEKGYSNTSIKVVCNELDMSPGNVTFYFPTKEHLLAEVVDMLCGFQGDMMEREVDEGNSSIMAICLELTAMATMCEDDEIIKDFFISSYSSPMCLEIIRKNDTERAKKVFRAYNPNWSDEQFAEAEILVSGIEYATLMTTGNNVPLEYRIEGALNNILTIYGVPEELRLATIEKVLKMDYKNIGQKVFGEFKKYVEKQNEQAFRSLFTT